MNPNINFIDLLQLHERKWGETRYPGRPALGDLMSATIVVVWTHEGRFMLTVHQEADEVNELAYRALSGDKSFNMRGWNLAMIYVNQQPIKFKLKIVSDNASKPAPKAPTKPLNEQSANNAQSFGREPIPLNHPPDLVPLNPVLVPLARQPEVVPYSPKVARENPQRRSRRVTYAEPHYYPKIAHQRPTFVTPGMYRVKPGREAKILTRPDKCDKP